MMATTMSVQTESFIDLLTTTFQATVIVTLIFGLGYFVAGQKYASREFGLVSIVILS
jgi:hypothetical protein